MISSHFHTELIRTRQQELALTEIAAQRRAALSATGDARPAPRKVRFRRTAVAVLAIALPRR